MPTVDETNRPCPCSAGWRCCDAVCFPEAQPCASPAQPHPRYAALTPGQALDLGVFTCVERPNESPGGCRRITDNGSLRYDVRNHRLWLLGGGGTANDALTWFDPFTARWETAYAATECSARTAANYDADLGAWVSGPGHGWPRPVATPPKDMLVFVPELNELVLLARGAVFADGCSSTEVDAEQGRVAHWSVDTGAWTFGDASVDAMPDDPAAYQSWEYEPRARLIFGVGQAGLYAYDPFTRTKRRIATGLDPTDTGFGNALVGIGDGGLLYFDSARAGVYQVELDSAALHQTRISRVASTGGYPGLAQPALAWDSRRRRVGGAVEDGVMWMYDPVAARFTQQVMQDADGGVADVGTMQAHCLDYDPVDDVFIFVTTLEGGFRTWAWRPNTTP